MARKESSLVSRIFDLLGVAGLLANEAKQALGRRAQAAFWRTVLLWHLSLWVSAGLFMLLWGALLLIAERSGLAWAWVLAVGGLLTMLTASLAFMALRHRQGSR